MAKKSGVSGALRREVMRRGKYRCATCGLKGHEMRFQRGSYGFPTERPRIYLSIDHVAPRAHGGASTQDNLRVLCTTCNTRKGTRAA